jgi:hypothetical protein
MRIAILTAALALACATLPVSSADAPTSPAANLATPPAKTVFLYGEASLDELRASNPRHYEIARAILANAPELCRPDPTKQFLSTSSGPAVCMRGFFLTSYPAKWQLAFRLDDVQYIALVTVKGLQPHLQPAR